MTAARGRLESSRKDLLDLGLRNSMISFGQPRNRLDIVDEVSTEVFRILVHQQKAMTFQPVPEAASNGADNPDDIDWAQVYEDDAGNNRHTDLRLQTKLGAEDLTQRLIRLESDARTHIEELGANVL